MASRHPAFLVALVLVACGGPAGRLDVPEAGFSMNVPAGWSVDPGNTAHCFDPAQRDDNRGWVNVFSAGGMALDEFVDSVIEEDRDISAANRGMVSALARLVGVEEETDTALPGSRVVSRTAAPVGGRAAIEVVARDGYSRLDVFIIDGDRVVEVLFRTLPQEFPRHEPNLRRALASVRFSP